MMAVARIMGVTALISWTMVIGKGAGGTADRGRVSHRLNTLGVAGPRRLCRTISRSVSRCGQRMPGRGLGCAHAG